MARQQARRHRRERVAGYALAVLGAIVLAIAIIALRQPSGHNVAAAATTGATAATSSVTPDTTARRSASQRSSSTPGSSTAKAGPSLSLGSSSSPAGSVKKVPLVVLNNSTVSGLASQAAQRFRDGGWTVSDTGNLQNTIISTCAYYDESVTDARAAAEALQAQYPTIKRVEPKFPELPSGPVVVVLTPDYSSG